MRSTPTVFSHGTEENSLAGLVGWRVESGEVSVMAEVERGGRKSLNELGCDVPSICNDDATLGGMGVRGLPGEWAGRRAGAVLRVLSFPRVLSFGVTTGINPPSGVLLHQGS